MDALLPGILHHGRVFDLVRGQPDALPSARLTVLVEDRLVHFDADAAPAEGLAPGELIAFSLLPGQAPGATPRAEQIVRLGGPASGSRWGDGDALRWRRPGQSPSRLALLRLRHALLRIVRATFDEQGFVEVDTPVLVRAPSPEPQFAPIAAGGEFLITSPEFQLKRLLVGGCERIYRIGPAFRGGERGRLHNPEFTLLEWYRAHADTDALAADLHGLLARLMPLAQSFAAERAHSPEQRAAPRLSASWMDGPLPRHSVADLFRRHLGMELRGVTTAEALLAAARAANWPQANGSQTNCQQTDDPREDGLPADFDAAFSRLWVALEAHFPPEPFLVVDWPAPLASLARLKPGDPSVAERMELYAGGLELANGFAELTDPVQQRTRFEAHLAQRRSLGLPPLPLDEAFLRALADGMPPSAGMALGLDRLTMLVAGVPAIRDVLAFASEER